MYPKLAHNRTWKEAIRKVSVEPLLDRYEYQLLRRIALFALKSDEGQYYRELAEGLNVAPEDCSILQAKLEA